MTDQLLLKLILQSHYKKCTFSIFANRCSKARWNHTTNAGCNHRYGVTLLCKEIAIILNEMKFFN